MFGASAMVSVWAAGFFVVGRDLKSVIGDSDISSIAGHVAAFFSGRDNYSAYCHVIPTSRLGVK